MHLEKLGVGVVTHAFEDHLCCLLLFFKLDSALRLCHFELLNIAGGLLSDLAVLVRLRLGSARNA